MPTAGRSSKDADGKLLGIAYYGAKVAAKISATMAKLKPEYADLLKKFAQMEGRHAVWFLELAKKHDIKLEREFADVKVLVADVASEFLGSARLPNTGDFLALACAHDNGNEQANCVGRMHGETLRALHAESCVLTSSEPRPLQAASPRCIPGTRRGPQLAGRARKSSRAHGKF